MEIWKHLDPTYEVSSLGRFRKGDRILKVSTAGQVKLHGQPRTAIRIVAENFLDKPPVLPHVVVRCRDGNRLNLSADNLYWAVRPRGREETRARLFREV